MSRGSPAESDDGGVSLLTNYSRVSTPKVSMQSTPSANARSTESRALVLHAGESRGRQIQDAAEARRIDALMAMQRRARGDGREPPSRPPAELAALIMSGATNPRGPVPEIGRRGRRSTNVEPSTIPLQYYEPPRRITTRAHIMGLISQSGRETRVFASAPKPANTMGNSIAYVNVTVQEPHIYLQRMTGPMPTVEQILADLPFIELCRTAAPSNAGVVRIKNMPYTSPRSELAAFLPKFVQVLAQPNWTPYHGVHIIMERHTGKTMDGFVEFKKASDANSVVAHFSNRIAQGRPPKLGDRQVAVSISSQDELLSELFPRTKNAYFDGGVPHIVETGEEYYPNVKAAEFTGFLQMEEITHMVKHAESPNRSPFAQRSFMRTYEAMISAIHKYPWFAHEFVYLEQCNAIFDAAFACIRALIGFLRSTQGERIADQTKPTPALLQELVVAICTCPGFNEKQKHEVITYLRNHGQGNLTVWRHGNMKLGGTSAIDAHWPFRVLARNPKHSDGYVAWIAAILKDATIRDERINGPKPSTLTPQQLLAKSQGPFGKVLIDYGDAKSMKQVGNIELKYVEHMLHGILPSMALQPLPTPRPVTRPPGL